MNIFIVHACSINLYILLLFHCVCYFLYDFGALHATFFFGILRVTFFFKFVPFLFFVFMNFENESTTIISFLFC